jgi:hypothetical protein
MQYKRMMKEMTDFYDLTVVMPAKPKPQERFAVTQATTFGNSGRLSNEQRAPLITPLQSFTFRRHHWYISLSTELLDYTLQLLCDLSNHPCSDTLQMPGSIPCPKKSWRQVAVTGLDESCGLLHRLLEVWGQ